MITWTDGLWMLLAVLGTALSALCAGAEMGAYAINRVRLSLDAERGVRRAQWLRAEIDRSPRLLASLLIGFNLFAYVGALGMTTLLQNAGFSEASIVLLNILVIGPVLFVAVDMMPKEVFRVEADRLMYTMAGPIRLLRWSLTACGVLPLVQLAARAVASLVPGEGEEEAVDSARQRVAVLLKEGARHGALSEAQASLVDRAFGLREARVADEMVPWRDVRLVSVSWDAAKLLAFARAHRQSRFPVVDDQGDVLGLVEHLDIALGFSQGEGARALLKPIGRLDAEMNVRSALVSLREQGCRLAVVMSAGRPLGVVTEKDLCEPLTGELKAW